MFPNLHNAVKMFYQANNDAGNGQAGGDNQQNNNQQQQQNDQGNQAAQPSYKTFDEWYNSLDENGKKLAAPGKAHFDSVYSTIKDVRKERDDFARQMRDAAKKLEAGSEQQKQFEKLATDLESANKRADFMEEAPVQECKNAKAAYAIATSQDLFKKDGSPDWKAIKEAAPELFGKSTVIRRGNAGSGNSQQTPGTSMNDWIRGQAHANTTTQSPSDL